LVTGRAGRRASASGGGDRRTDRARRSQRPYRRRALHGRGRAIDVLVAQRALPARGPLLEFDTDQIDRALRRESARTDHDGAERRGRHARAGRGHIVFISSISGKVAAPGTSLYSATKFGPAWLSPSACARICTEPASASPRSSPDSSARRHVRGHEGHAAARGRTRTPEQVAAAVLRAIRDDPRGDHGGLGRAVVSARSSPASAIRGGVDPTHAGVAKSEDMPRRRPQAMTSPST